MNVEFSDLINLSVCRWVLTSASCSYGDSSVVSTMVVIKGDDDILRFEMYYFQLRCRQTQ